MYQTQQIILQRIILMTVNMESKSYDERVMHLVLWTLEEHRKRQDLIMRQIYEGISPVTQKHLFTVDDTKKETRGIRVN